MQHFVGADVFKALAPFAFATMLGGIVTLFVNLLKDDEDVRSRQREKQRKVLSELDKAYRDTKHIRRVLRSRSMYRADGSFEIPVEFFEEKLDELNRVQLSLEQLRNIGLSEFDGLSRERAKNVKRAIRYAARYLHDVFQDFEQARVLRQASTYSITPSCTNLCDFVGSPSLPPDLERYHEQMADDELSLDERWNGFNRIADMRRAASGRRRYKTIAEECFRLVQADLIIISK